VLPSSFNPTRKHTPEKDRAQDDVFYLSNDMKPRAAALLTLVVSMGAILGLHARATKDNVGTPLPELHLQFSGDAARAAKACPT
jgi:hypothetical protein